jgi:hypothetical protein
MADIILEIKRSQIIGTHPGSPDHFTGDPEGGFLIGGRNGHLYLATDLKPGGALEQ